MPATQSDYDKVKALRQQASASTAAAGGLTSGAQTFSDQVMARVREARAARGVDQLSQDIGTTTGQIYSAPADIRARTANVNPLQVDALTARQSAQTLGTLATTANVQAQRQGTITDILGAGTNQLLAAAEQKKAEANAANIEAQNILEMLQEKRAQEAATLQNALTRTKIAAANKTATNPFEGKAFDELTPEDIAGAALNDPDNLSLYKWLADLQGGQGGNEGGVQDQINRIETLSERSKAKQASAILTDVAEAEKLLAESQQLGGAAGTGPLAALQSSIKSKVGVSDAQTQLGVLLSRMFDRERLRSTGAAFSEKELGELEKFRGKTRQQEAAVLERLQDLKREMYTQLTVNNVQPRYLISTEGDLVEAESETEYQSLINQGYTPWLE